MKHISRPFSLTKTRFAWGVLVVCFLLTTSGYAYATRCEGGIVSVGDTKYEVLSKCGEPSFTDERQVERIERTGVNELIRWTVHIEEWTYDFGPGRFIRILTFEEGRLARIRDGIYGKSTPDDGATYVRENRIVQPGDSKYEVIIKLGRPVYSETREVEKANRTKTGDVVVRTITYEEWTYDFGPRRFIRRIIFEDGRVVRVENGDYGRR